MKWLRRILCVLVMLVVSNLVAVVCVLPLYRRTGEWQLPLAACLLVLLLILILMRPLGNVALPTRRIRQLAAGAELLLAVPGDSHAGFGFSAVVFDAAEPLDRADGYEIGIGWLVWGGHVLLIVAVAAAVFWAGMIRVYLTSVQLGLKHRVLAALCGWHPSAQHLVPAQDHPHRLRRSGV